MAISKKGKDASRAERKANKRKLEDAIPDLPDDNEAVELPEAPSGTEEKGSKKRKRNNDEHDTTENGAALGDVQRKAAKKKREEKKRLRSKKDKFVGDDENIVKEENKSKKAEEADQVNEGSLIQIAKPEDSTEDAAAPRRSKKERKAERKARETAEAAANKAVETTPLGLALVPDGKAAIAEEKKSKKNNRNRERKRKGVNDQAKVVDGNGDIAKAKPTRFIVFIGNLPFSATTESIRKHFAAIKPISVRCLTQRDDPVKSKGCAFVEFEGYDHMKTCLKLFHHSTFDDGVSPPRNINVELTAGGGGNTKDRRTKIGEKNQKLNEQRIRRFQEEEKAKSVKNAASINQSAIHPSRRARVADA